jgi:hypothetical protein
MAKTKSQAAQQPRSTRRADPERWGRILIIGGVAAIIIAAIGFIGFGWYQTQIRPLSKTILQVGEIKFSLSHLERRIELELRDNPFALQPGQDPRLLTQTMMVRFEREAKLIEGAEELEITISQEEVAEEVRFRGNLAQAVVADVYGIEFRRQVEVSGLEVNEYQQMLRAELIEVKVRDYFTFLTPAAEPQVHARWIRADDDEGAQEILQRLDAGDDFVTVAEEDSTDRGTAEDGGDLSWRPRGAFPSIDMEDFLFDEAEPGDHSTVFSTAVGLYIVQLVEREDERELDDTLRSVVAAREMSEWLQELDQTLDIERDLTPEDEGRALNDVL